jgi:hypothetical protein
MKYQKASAGATMTWVVATIIILVLITVFIYASFVMAKAKGGSNGGAVASTYLLRETPTQQTLLALLETDTGEMKIKDYIISEDYKNLEQKLKPILEKLPGHKNGNWVFTIYKNNKIQLQIGKPTEIIENLNPSIVYLSDKKILLGFEYKYTPI